MWNGQKLNESTPETIISTLQNCCVLYYGTYSSNIPDIIIKEAIKVILKRFPTITLHEIKHSFERLTPLEKPKITLMLSDVVDPITRYVYIKNFISKEAIKLSINEAEAERRNNSHNIFVQESIDMYKRSLKDGIWHGNIFQAAGIAREYLAKYIPQDVKDIMWIEAKKECRRISNDPELLIDNIAVTPIRLFSKKIVIACIELGIEI